MGTIMHDVFSDVGRVTPIVRKDRFMQDPIIVDVLSYWETLRNGRLAPMRSELDPRKITNSLQHTFVLEYNNSQDVRFRLAGMKLNEIMGMELRGMPARALISLGCRDELCRIIDDLIMDPKIVELHLTAETDHKTRTTARMLMLPMQNENGEICRILGCMTAQGPLMQQPQRFDIADIKKTRIVGVQETPQADFGFQEDAAAFEGPTEFVKPELPSKTNKPRTKRLVAGKPYLRLVKDS